MSDDPAKPRFLAIMGLRWAGMALVALGLVALYRPLPVPPAAAYGVIVIGLVAALVLPTVLARRWRTPRR